MASTDVIAIQQTEVESLSSTQEDTDSRVALYLFYMQEKDYRTVVVHSPDSDICLSCGAGDLMCNVWLCKSKSSRPGLTSNVGEDGW